MLLQSRPRNTEEQAHHEPQNGAEGRSTHCGDEGESLNGIVKWETVTNHGRLDARQHSANQEPDHRITTISASQIQLSRDRYLPSDQYRTSPSRRSERALISVLGIS